MSKRILLAFVIVLTLAAFVACGGDEETVEQPVVAMTELAPAVEPAAAVAMTTEPDMSDSTDVVMAGGMALADDCVAGGGLTEADAIIACNLQAMQRFTSFSFDGEFDLFAAFPIEGAPAMAPAMQLSGAVVLPDKSSFTLRLGPEGEAVETTGIIIGEDFYGQDPETQQWFKGAPGNEQSLSPLQMAGMLYLPQDIPTSLEEVIELDDGGKAYVLVSEQADFGGEAAMLGLSDGGLTRVVGADDFLTREIRVAVEGPDGQSRDLFSIRYHGFGDELSIEPPESFVELPPGAMSSGVQEPATVVGLTRNADGNVEVRFSKPVTAEGEIVLYVLEPSTGGWELPLLSGSGTDTLVFDAAAEGSPTLVAGEHEIAFIGFGGNAKIVGADGVRANDLFDAWKYE
jgi:hypothetical protein